MARELSFMEHLGELRRRVLICALAIVVGTGVSFVFFNEIIEFLVRPSGLETGKDGQLIITEVTEFLTTAFKVSVLSGFVLALPVVIYQVIMFVAPGLTRRERRLLFGFLPLVLLAFVAGMAFGYFILTPPALHFLLNFGEDVVTPLIRVSNIVNLMVRLLFWDGGRLRDAADNVSASPAWHCVVAAPVTIPEGVGGRGLHSGGAHHPDLRPREPDPGRPAVAGPL